MLEPQVIKRGDDSGNRMLVRFDSPSGARVHGMGIPQAWETPLGPTWCYVVEADHLTLIDPGCYGPLEYIEEGLAHIGYSLQAISRVVVTHGHMDHDGNCLSVVERSGAELWAHEVYPSLLRADRWERETAWRQNVAGFDAFQDSDVVERVKEHHRRSEGLTVSRPVTDGVSDEGLTYFYTPGHSPDELCIQFDGFMFTGDHVLPQITPHPSVARSYASFRTALPEAYRASNEIYGLKALLRSLKRVAGMGDDIQVLPAHRAYNRGRFNLVGLERATEIVDHHRERCADLIDILRRQPRDLPSLTRDHFSHRELGDGNFFLALTEVMSHVEFLVETGDVSINGGGGGGELGGEVEWNGTEAFPEFIDGLDWSGPPGLALETTGPKLTPGCPPI